MILGNRTEVTENRSNDEVTSSVVFVPETMEYISVMGTLQKLLNDTDSFHSLKSNINISVNGLVEILHSYRDSEYFQQHH
jgi:hypothetical protein